MKIVDYDRLSQSEKDSLLKRPASDFSDIDDAVRSILRVVERQGDSGVRELERKFDKAGLSNLRVTEAELEIAAGRTSKELREAITQATGTLKIFHKHQQAPFAEVETVRGVRCKLEWRPIDRVGLYVPGGSAPLISTVLMLSIPAMLAGCPEVILCTPPMPDGSVANDLLYAASSLGVKSIFKIGGAQAVAAMAVGTESIRKVSKIFGPGNRYVTAMKSIVSRPPYNAAIDMLAGPSELLIIADETANPRWVAADLLSQAEHGADSPVVLVTVSPTLAEIVKAEIARQLSDLPRKSIAARAMDQSFTLLVKDLEEAVDFSNSYAPEHLILAVKNAESVAREISNAGSVFVGSMTSVVFGDYASGTNHTLPTGGLANAFGGLTVLDFMKPVFFQTVTPKGLARLSSTVKTLARAEGLEGHARAVEVREQDHD